jgi:hypothetical protein
MSPCQNSAADSRSPRATAAPGTKKSSSGFQQPARPSRRVSAFAIAGGKANHRALTSAAVECACGRVNVSMAERSAAVSTATSSSWRLTRSHLRLRVETETGPRRFGPPTRCGLPSAQEGTFSRFPADRRKVDASSKECRTSFYENPPIRGRAFIPDVSPSPHVSVPAAARGPRSRF